ncbi:dynamin family protein [Paenibacillus sp. 37]|uniref:dynamin family protein n=1 Tax=Paenibacillus sp. 37 TaxID=2607911 RepID=UPI00122E814A|nr:dynamin family protein [Paenibacillus sp. 37]
MKEKTLVNALLAILKKDDIVERYFRENIRWLEDRTRYWQKHHIRVGLVGVTSSGKSTLLNALMGESLLPTAVRPSSGILVTCTKGEENEATVYFENGTPKIFSGPILANQLEYFADERLNPKNHKGVTYIELKSSQFTIDPAIQIVDSPGLDAYGLERHESLTMETLLPTVDVCLFVVTMKANSDESTYRVLKSVSDHNKPLIIVQNMLDSVEPKKGLHGIVLKTREEIALEHKNRVMRIVGKVDIQLENTAILVQVSAKQALMGQQSPGSHEKYEASRISQLIHSLQQQVDQLRPFIARERVHQLKRHVEEMLHLEIEGHAGIEQEYMRLETRRKQLYDWEEEKRDLSKIFMKTRGSMTNMIQKIKTTFDRTLAEIDAFEQTKIDDADHSLQSLKNEVEGAEQLVIQTGRIYDRKVKSLSKKLNINEGDYKGDLLPGIMRSSNAFTVSKKIMQETYKERKSGLFGGPSRFLGKIFKKDNWGYEEKEQDVEIIDIEAIRRRLTDNLSEIVNPLSAFRDQWAQRISVQLDIVRNEIERRKEEFRIKVVSIEEKQHIQSVMNDIRDLMEQEGYPIEVKPEEQSQSNRETAATSEVLDEVPLTAPVTEKSRSVIEIDSSVLALYTLSHQLVMSSFSVVFDFAQGWTDNSSPIFSTSVIWGWDEISLSDFCVRFLHRQLNEEDLELFQKQGFLYKHVENHRYIVVNEYKLNENARKQLFSLLNHEPYRTYMLVNTVQQGATIKQIKTSLIHQVDLTKKSIFHWVSQSFTEFIEGDNVAEGLRSLMEISEQQLNCKKGLYLINHPNPIYSLLLTELSLKKQMTIDDERKLQAALSKTCAHLVVDQSILQNCASLMRAYIEN